MKRSTEWHLTLKPGDLAIAHNAATKRRHIVRLTACGSEIDSRHGELDRRGKIRDYSACWEADSLCGVGESRATFGRWSSFYWQPCPEPIATYIDDKADVLCVACRRRWRADGEPPIRNDVEAPLEVDYQPPFGWREVPAVGHPWDVPPGGDPEQVKDATGKVRGKRRTEIRRWQRGTRVVRITRYYEEGYDGAHYGDVDEPLDEHSPMTASPDAIRREAQEYMARGGS